MKSNKADKKTEISEWFLFSSIDIAAHYISVWRCENSRSNEIMWEILYKGMDKEQHPRTDIFLNKNETSGNRLSNKMLVYLNRIYLWRSSTAFLYLSPLEKKET